MIRLTRAPNLLIAQHWMNLLAQARIACEMHNQYLLGAMGDIPADQCGPEIWLEHERDLDLASRIIDGGWTDPDQSRAHWCCASCGEWSEPQFTLCWRCGAAREDGQAPPPTR
ncbi:DUF2007 domain-containing protein [Bordetella bronchialis]|uniref:DUF2007 domain-containing protein n=1 Tax=Bordetella bronchialis TaxID=463025 RepID=A0A193G0M7_9BORD|nr:DUF2007 domain-containing protein [Bordetella bronchialis]ANN73203.1 hypothetical protein BAU08_19280 [Bordetella bronchialis]